MDNYFPDDEYQSQLTFSSELIGLEILHELIRLSIQEVRPQEVEFLHVLPIIGQVEIEKIRGILINKPSYVPAAIVISVKSFLNPEGKESPLSWYAETELRRAMLVEVEAHGLGVYFRPIYPNLHFVRQMCVVTNNGSEFLPMSCLFLGYQDRTQPGLLQRFESKVRRDKDSADHWSAGL